MSDFNPNNRPIEDFSDSRSIVVRAFHYVLAAFLDLVEGLDLNRYRPGVDIRVAKQQGIRFIITKATQGTTIFDPEYEYYRDEAKSKGLPFGAYCYWQANTDPIKQAQYFFDHVGDDIDLLPILDVEKYGNQNVLSQANAAQHIYDTLLEIERLFGRPAMIYTNRDSWQVLTGNSSIIKLFALWVASWTTAISPWLPIGAEDWVFWQYTNNYRVEGYSKGIDGNLFNGNEGEFENYVASLKGDTPPSEHDHAEILRRLDDIDSELVIIKSRIAQGNLNDIDHENRLKLLESGEIAVSERVSQIENF
jgi:lysozyme